MKTITYETDAVGVLTGGMLTLSDGRRLTLEAATMGGHREAVDGGNEVQWLGNAKDNKGRRYRIQWWHHDSADKLNRWNKVNQVSPEDWDEFALALTQEQIAKLSDANCDTVLNEDGLAVAVEWRVRAGPDAYGCRLDNYSWLPFVRDSTDDAALSIDIGTAMKGGPVSDLVLDLIVKEAAAEWKNECAATREEEGIEDES